MVTVNELQYGIWGNCIRVTNGDVELIATLDCGPRVIRYGFVGSQNMLFEDTSFGGQQSGKAFDDYFGKGSVWYNRGGHRLWISPEELPRSYYPDNEKVKCKKKKNGFILTPPLQKKTYAQFKFDITMLDDGKVKIDHYITNNGAWDTEYAAWALTVLNHGGVEIIPQPTRNTGLLNNRVIGMWPYSKFSDARLKMLDKYIVLKQDPKNTDAFKIGLASEHGYAAYILGKEMFVKRFELKDGNYPDGGMSFESYTNDLIIEMESIGPLTKLKPGETLKHTEKWEMVKNVKCKFDTDEDIDRFVKKYILK